MPVKPEDRTPLLKRLISDFNIKLLYWDLECSPCIAYIWKPGDDYISYEQIKEGKETKIITIQYMWEGDKAPKYLVWDKLGAEDFCDKSMVEEYINSVIRKHPINEVLIIGQNHKAFDHKLLNERAKVHRIIPPLFNHIKVDTLKQSKASFKAISHTLNHRSKQQGLGGKIKTDMAVWTDILEGKTEPEDVMIPYGLKDVTDLKEIFWAELPYWEKLPAPLEKLLARAQVRCLKCEERKQSKYDLEECKVNKKNGWKCNNCNTKFIFEE